MKTILKIMSMITIMVIIAGSSAYGQVNSNTCANTVPPGGCAGACSGVLWSGPNAQVPGADIYIGCENINGHCKCVAYTACPQCRGTQKGKCDASCPSLYLVPGGPAIKGKSFNTSTPSAAPVCGCKYVLN